MTIQEKIARAIEIKKVLDEHKPLYEELDQLTVEIAGMDLVTGGVYFVNDHHVYVVDNFEEKNTVFRPAAVKRFELKILTQEEKAKKDEKERKRKEREEKKAKKRAQAEAAS